MALNKIIREQVYSKCNGKCAYCASAIEYSQMQVDHVIPQSDFVSHVKNRIFVPQFLSHLTVNDVDHIDNLMPTCRVCNKWKSNFSLEYFRKEIFEQIKRLNDYSSNYRIAKMYGLVTENSKPIVFYFESI